MTTHTVRRREFIALLGGAAAAGPLAARAQQGGRVRRVGVLMETVEDDPQQQARLAALRDELAKLGWSEGRNLRIDTRFPAGDHSRVFAMAAELAALAPGAIVAACGPAI